MRMKRKSKENGWKRKEFICAYISDAFALSSFLLPLSGDEEWLKEGGQGFENKEELCIEVINYNRLDHDAVRMESSESLVYATKRKRFIWTE